MLSELKGTHPLTKGTKSALASRVRSASRVNQGRSALRPRAVMEMNRPAATNGASSGAVKPEAIEDEVKAFARYRLSAEAATKDGLYKATAWSVHNRLVDSFEKTHAHWEYVSLQTLNTPNRRPPTRRHSQNLFFLSFSFFFAGRRTPSSSTTCLPSS
jgi:hypothetical protein